MYIKRPKNLGGGNLNLSTISSRFGKKGYRSEHDGVDRAAWHRAQRRD